MHNLVRRVLMLVKVKNVATTRPADFPPLPRLPQPHSQVENQLLPPREADLKARNFARRLPLCEGTEQPKTEGNRGRKHGGRRTTESGARSPASRHVLGALSVCLFIHRLGIPALQSQGRSHQQQAEQRHCFKPTTR